MSETTKPEPQVGDVWTFKTPGKRRKTKEIERIGTVEVLLERGTYPKWKDKTKIVPYVHWSRQNKGRYTGITVERLVEFGERVSTKAERDAHFNELVARRRQKLKESQ